ncbi:hypothetical protein PSJ8397_02101 [Pseudooctadecabacter jejudonensis]|uniref:Uncharacterized protein n=1 Tax=Pseudooctadecabacter jejudonensis TaxID=1391910 RepID=A0A1Y5SNJ0_9RHOB|nr:hypothetical protein PSJ8397_02101 [Pseudooctadecabacter jejudonensis]
MFDADPSLCFADVPSGSRPNFSAFATQEPSRTNWPLADGVISLPRTVGGDQDDVALEYKRVAEGTHGLLTAVGQSLAYIDKGYNGAVIVIPRSYSSHGHPAEHVVSILDSNEIDGRVGVFDYEDPDKSSPYPFRGRIRCIRPITVAPSAIGKRPSASKPSTQWVHLREGSTTRDVIYCYLKSAILLAGGGSAPPSYGIPEEMVSAVSRIDATADVEEFLGYTSDSSLGSQIWKDFWFKYVATPEVLTPFKRSGSTYVAPAAFTKVLKDDGSGHSQIFEGRANGLKETICTRLNDGVIAEDQAWEEMANGISISSGQNKQGVRSRAHSYREDVDSAVAQLQWIDNSGQPTDEGYRFVSICERFGGPNSSAAVKYFGATLIQTGHYGTFLHYVHRLSEEIFLDDPLAFSKSKGGVSVFDEDSYWEYLRVLQSHMENDLKVLRKVSGRSRPRSRTIFQAELTFLRKYGFIPESRSNRYRLGVGLPINWVRVNEAMQVEL